jgi:hypothetical protein
LPKKIICENAKAAGKSTFWLPRPRPRLDLRGIAPMKDIPLGAVAAPLQACGLKYFA